MARIFEMVARLAVVLWGVSVGLAQVVETQRPIAQSNGADQLDSGASDSQPSIRDHGGDLRPKSHLVDVTNDSRTDQAVNPAGGAATADFASLMNLIQNTITPDNWQANGGTSNMLPYPSGVWVDPRGKLQRIDRSGHSMRDSHIDPAASSEDSWHLVSRLRTLSLKKIDQAVADVIGHAPADRMKYLQPELIQLAGLNRITHVWVDLEHQDVILAGPADVSHCGFFLEDLAVVCGLINHQTAALGCTIEPSQQELLKTQQFVSNRQATAMLARSPRDFTHRMRQMIGEHEVQVFGMPAQCGTAIALVAADEHMKQLAFGEVRLPKSVANYFDFLDGQPVTPQQSLIRWWFAFSDEPITANQEGTLFRLPDDSVQVLSQQQFVTLVGRQPTGKNDKAADDFAEELSRRLSEIRQMDLNYSRLCCVFEVALALQLALESIQQVDYQDWFPNLYGLGKAKQHSVREPKQVDGLATWHRLKSNRTIVAVVSGGVSIDPKQTADRQRWKVSQLLSSQSLLDRHYTDSSSNWWSD